MKFPACVPSTQKAGWAELIALAELIGRG